MDTRVLKELGFSDREIKVYVALIELGPGTVGPISAKSGLPYTKVYETLGKLVQKGLATFVVVKKRKNYQAADPHTIMDMIDERKKRFSSLLKELELKQKFAKEKQIATVYEGFKSVKALFNRIAEELSRGETYRVFAFKEDYKDPSAPRFLSKFHEKLAEKRVEDRIIASAEVKKEIRQAYKDNTNIKIRFVQRNTPLGVMIFKGKVIQLIWGERPTAIEITSSQIHDQYKKFFEEMWKEGKP